MAATEEQGNRESEGIHDFLWVGLYPKKLVEAVNIGLKRPSIARVLEGEETKLKVVDLMVDKKLERTRLCIEELRSKLKSLR